MKRLNKFISSIVLTAFLINSTVSDLALAQTPTDKLAIPSMCDDLVGIQHKDMGRIKLALELQLAGMAKARRGGLPADFQTLKTIIGQKTFKENTKFSPADIQFFFHEMKRTMSGPCVMCRIIDPDMGGQIRTYHAIFSIESDPDGGFPVSVYTEDEFKAFIDAGAESIPARKPGDLKAIDRYVEHEKRIDAFIAGKMESTENFYEIRASSFEMARLNHLLLTGAYGVRELQSALEPYAGNGWFSELLQRQRVVIIGAENSELPIIKEGGKSVRVHSHASANGIYLFMDKNSKEEIRELCESNLNNPLSEVASLKTASPLMVHELGAVLGFPFEIAAAGPGGVGAVINDLDTAYRASLVTLEDTGYVYDRVYIDAIQRAGKHLENKWLNWKNEFKALSYDYNMNTNLPGRDYMAGETVTGQSMAMNPYWQTVEEDIGGFIQAGTAIGIDKDGVIWNVKTGAAIYRHPQDRGQFLKIGDMYYAEAAETIGALREKLDEIISECDIFLADRSSVFFPDIMNKKWEELSGHDFNLNTNPDNPGARKFVGLIRDWAKTARDIDIYLVPGNLYASPRTKEIAHVRRGINQSSPGIWLGSQFIENARRKYFDHNTYLEKSAAWTLAILMIDEAMHVGNSKPHGSVGSVADLDDGITHFLTPNDHIITSIIQTGEARGDLPWDPMLPGGNVGKGKAMREFFDRLTQFASSESSEVLLIEGPSGVGKNMAVDAIREMMRTHKDDRFPDRGHTRFARISCAEFSGMSAGEIRRDLFGDANNPGLITKALTGERQSIETSPILIIDELPDASPELQGQLLRVLDENKSINVPGLGEIDLTDLKVICLANRDVDHLRPDLLNRISHRIEVPTLLKRELADEGQTVLLAEYFNYKASKASNIPWAPFDEWMGEAFYVLAKLTGYDFPDTKDARNLKHFVENIVKTRALLLKGAPALDRIPDSAAWARNIFSPYLITCADLIAVKTDFMDRRLSTTLTADYARRRYAVEPLLPYFKELAPRDASGNIVGFHKGPRGEQPGLPFEGIVSDTAAAPEDAQKAILRDAAMLSPLALRILKAMSIKTSTGEKDRPDTVAYDLFTSKEEFTAGQVYHYWWFWRMVTNFEALYSEAKDGFRDDRLFEALNELRRAGFVSAERDIRDLESKFRATDRLRDIISAFPLAINGFTADAEDGFFRARGGTAICPNGDLEIKAPEARGGADIFEFEQNVADTVSKAILTYLTASSRNTRQDNKDILMKNKEAAYVIGMSALSSLGVTFGIKDPPLGKNAMAAYRMLIKDLRANGRITTGSAQHGEFIKLINELAVYIREPYKSFAETLKGGRVGRPTNPGKSPEDALLLIAVTDLKDRDFTLKEYLAAYNKFGMRLGFSAPAAHPETTARNDLYLAKKSLEKTGLLRIVNKKAVDNKKEREYRFRLTSLGQAQGNIARLRYKAVILFFNAGFASDADEEDPVYYKRYGIGRYDSLRTTIRHKTMSISFAYINAPPSLSGKTKGRDYSFGPRSTKVTLQDTRSYEEYTYRGPFPVIDMRTDLNGRIIEYVVTKEFYDFCAGIGADSYMIKGSSTGRVLGGVAMVSVEPLTGTGVEKKTGSGRSKAPGKSPAAMMMLIAEYLKPGSEISAPKLLNLYKVHWQELGLERPVDDRNNALRTIERDLFELPDSLENTGMVTRKPGAGVHNEFLFDVTEPGRRVIATYLPAKLISGSSESAMARIMAASVAVPVSINRGHRDSSTDWYMALQTIVFDRSLQGKPFTVDQLIAASVAAGDCFRFSRFTEKDARGYIEFMVAHGYLRKTSNEDEYQLTPDKGKEQVEDLEVELGYIISEYRDLVASLETDPIATETEAGIPQAVRDRLASVAEEYGIEPTDADIEVLYSIWRGEIKLDQAMPKIMGMGVSDAGSIASMYHDVTGLVLGMAGVSTRKDIGDKELLSEESGSPADILINKFGLRTYAELKNGRGFISNTPDYVFFAGQSKEWNTGMPVLQVYDVRHGEPELIQETEHYKHGYYNDRYFAVLSYEKNHPYGYKDVSILSVYDLRDNMKRVMVMRLDRKWEKVTLKSHYLMLEGEQYARLIDIESKKDVIDPEKLRSRASDCYLFSDYFVMYTPQRVDVYENATGRLVVSLRRVDTGRDIPHYMSKVTQITDTHLLFETVEEPYLGTRYGIVIRLKDGQEVVRHAYEGDDRDHKAFELTDNYLEEYTFSKGRNAVYDLRTGRRLENIEDLRTEADIERERQREESEKEKPFVTMLKNQKFSQLVSLLTQGLQNGDDEAVRRICRVINSADKDAQMAFFTSAAWIKFRGDRKGEDAPSESELSQSTDKYGYLKATKTERDLLISIARRHGASRLTDEDIEVLINIWRRIYSFDDAYPKIQDMGISDRDTALNMFNEISALVLGMAGAGEKPVVNADKTGALGNFDTIASISNKYGVEPGILKNIYFRVPSAILILPQAIEILNASMFKNYAGLWMDTYIKSVRTILDPDAPSEIRRKEIQALHVHFATLSHNTGKNLSDRDLLKELSAIVEEDEAREKRLDKALIFIARSDTLQKMMAESGGFRLPDYLAVCPEALRPTAQGDLDLLVSKDVLTCDRLGNYTAASAFNSKMLGLRNLMLEAGRNSKEEASMQAVWQLQQTINEISSNETLAKQVGLEMPTNEHKRYTLLLPKAFFKQGEDELKNDKDRFGDRFEIDMVDGNYADALLRNAVTRSRDNARASVLLIPSDFGVTAEDLAKLKGVGMSYMIVDAEALKEAQNAADRERADFRTDTYAIMWLARYVKDADPASSGAFNLLRFYLKTHFALTDVTVEDYIDALVTGNIATIIKGYLKYKPSVLKDAEADYHRVAAALIFA